MYAPTPIDVALVQPAKVDDQAIGRVEEAGGEVIRAKWHSVQTAPSPFVNIRKVRREQVHAIARCVGFLQVGHALYLMLLIPP